MFDSARASVVTAASGAGTGVFAAQDLAPGAVACRFEGPVVPFADVPASEIRHALWIDDDRWLIPRAPARFINHACEPNCSLRDDPGNRDAALVVAVRAIEAGEEICISYDWVDARLLAEHADDPAYAWNPAWTFQCRCAAPNCRGLIDRYSPRPAGA